MGHERRHVDLSARQHLGSGGQAVRETVEDYRGTLQIKTTLIFPREGMSLAVGQLYAKKWNTSKLHYKRVTNRTKFIFPLSEMSLT